MGANATRRRLGNISAATLAELAQKGKLVPAKRDERGWKMYDPEVVEAFAASYPRAYMAAGATYKRKVARTVTERRYEGSVASRVFAYFRRGQPLQVIVLECKVSPGYVRELWREWSTTLEEGEQMRAAEKEERVALREARDRERRELREEMTRVRRRDLDLRERELRRAAKADRAQRLPAESDTAAPSADSAPTPESSAA